MIINFFLNLTYEIFLHIKFQNSRLMENILFFCSKLMDLWAQKKYGHFNHFFSPKYKVVDLSAWFKFNLPLSSCYWEVESDKRTTKCSYKFSVFSFFDLEV